jgi:5-methylcytosine-specific restriction endonuclease McrA
LPWQRALKGLYEDTLVAVHEYDQTVRSPSTEIKLPSVVALKQFHNLERRVAFTRFNVFLRDRFKCQYCGEKFSASELTFDHVIPRAAGGQTTWDNIVTACEPCNGLKDHGQTMRPARWPSEPTAKELSTAKRAFPPSYLHESWIDYLYWDAVLEE